MGKRSSFFDRYWFAIGYHSCLSGDDGTPRVELADYLMEKHGVDISKSYDNGFRIAMNDKENGNV